MHHALERLDCPAAQGLTTKEGHLVELRAVAEREALEKAAHIKTASHLKFAAVAGPLEQLRIHLQVDRGRPSNRRPVGCKNIVSEHELQAMQQASKPRPYDGFGIFRPQHGSNDVAADRALR